MCFCELCEFVIILSNINDHQHSKFVWRIFLFFFFVLLLSIVLFVEMIHRLRMSILLWCMQFICLCKHRQNITRSFISVYLYNVHAGVAESEGEEPCKRSQTFEWSHPQSQIAMSLTKQSAKIASKLNGTTHTYSKRVQKKRDGGAMEKSAVSDDIATKKLTNLNYEHAFFMCAFYTHY